jgi:hypothetical protein
MTGPTGPLTGLITGFYVSRETTTNKAKDARIPTAADRAGAVLVTPRAGPGTWVGLRR